MFGEVHDHLQDAVAGRSRTAGSQPLQHGQCRGIFGRHHREEPGDARRALAHERRQQSGGRAASVPIVANGDGDVGARRLVLVPDDPGHPDDGLRSLVRLENEEQGDVVDTVDVVDQMVEHRVRQVRDSGQEPVEPGLRRELVVRLLDRRTRDRPEGTDHRLRAVPKPHPLARLHAPPSSQRTGGTWIYHPT
jgi:hypothetical protein